MPQPLMTSMPGARTAAFSGPSTCLSCLRTHDFVLCGAVLFQPPPPSRPQMPGGVAGARGGSAATSHGSHAGQNIDHLYGIRRTDCSSQCSDVVAFPPARVTSMNICGQQQQRVLKDSVGCISVAPLLRLIGTDGIVGEEMKAWAAGGVHAPTTTSPGFHMNGVTHSDLLVQRIRDARPATFGKGAASLIQKWLRWTDGGGASSPTEAQHQVHLSPSSDATAQNTAQIDVQDRARDIAADAAAEVLPASSMVQLLGTLRPGALPSSRGGESVAAGNMGASKIQASPADTVERGNFAFAAWHAHNLISAVMLVADHSSAAQRLESTTNLDSSPPTLEGLDSRPVSECIGGTHHSGIHISPTTSTGAHMHLLWAEDLRQRLNDATSLTRTGPNSGVASGTASNSGRSALFGSHHRSLTGSGLRMSGDVASLKAELDHTLSHLVSYHAAQLSAARCAARFSPQTQLIQLAQPVVGTVLASVLELEQRYGRFMSPVTAARTLLVRGSLVVRLCLSCVLKSCAAAGTLTTSCEKYGHW
jgi:hypothetical protein